MLTSLSINKLNATLSMTRRDSSRYTVKYLLTCFINVAGVTPPLMGTVLWTGRAGKTLWINEVLRRAESELPLNDGMHPGWNRSPLVFRKNNSVMCVYPRRIVCCTLTTGLYISGRYALLSTKFHWIPLKNWSSLMGSSFSIRFRRRAGSFANN